MPRQQRAIWGEGEQGSLGNTALLSKGAGHAFGHIGGVAGLEPGAHARRQPIEIDLAELREPPVRLAMGDL